MGYPLESFENEVTQSLQDVLATQFSLEDTTIKLEWPPEEKGDLAFPCFSLASSLKKPPTEIAQTLAEKIDVAKKSWIKRVTSAGPYLNFFVDTQKLAQETLAVILQKTEEYGELEKKNETVIVEHTSANPNGPLHVGRARNPIIGDTLTRIYKAAGYSVESQFYLDDMGKQVAILVWGVNNIDHAAVEQQEYRKDKPDHHRVRFYQLAHQQMQEKEEVAQEIADIVKRSEQGDQTTLDMVHEAYAPALEGIKESLRRINITVENYVPESRFVKNKDVDDVIAKLKKSSYCHEENGAYYLDLAAFGIQGRTTKFFLTRQDGTSLYATRDVAYHRWKAQQADVLINVLGEDHKLESKQVEIALKLLDTTILPRVVFYAFVSLPEGKMSTRRDRVVYLDDLVDECVSRAYDEVEKRRGDELTSEQMKEIARVVGIGALRYNIIKVQPEKDIMFRWEEALNFEGDAAPFIQYAHARTAGILKKANEATTKVDAALLTHDSETQLIKTLARLPMKIQEAMKTCRPNIIAQYAYQVAADFNQFYRDCPVLQAKENRRETRLALVEATKITLHNTLRLLGIDAPEEM